MSTKTKCRVDGSELKSLFSLGDLHISDFIEDKPKGSKNPLSLAIGEKSNLIQLDWTSNPDEMYKEYWYRSGTNATMKKELADIANSATKLANLSSGDTILDIGCNDGTLLSNIDKGVTRIGIDPAKNGYKDLSCKHADHIVDDYFSANTFNGVSKNKAHVITSIAMFYDLDDPNSFVQDIYNSLDDDGLWIVQMSYTPLMIKQLAFDNICHEHLQYYSLNSFEYLIDRHNFEIVDCVLNDINGGSFRLYLKKKHNAHRFATQPYRDICGYRIESIRQMEKSLKLDFSDGLEIYKDFINNIEDLKHKVVSFIEEKKSEGKTVWGYGASTKGNTLLQFFGLDHTLIDGIAERSPSKYGLKTVGTNIPIYAEAEMRKVKPDYLLVLPWHFISEFVTREKDYLANGGAFIVPCPKFEVITA